MKNKKRSFKSYFKTPIKCPYYMARSFMIGTSLAFAPIPGQTPLIFGLWLISKKSKYKFSLLISIGLSFISNIFTNAPLFYAYYKTGQYIFNLNKGYNFILGSFLFMLAGAIIGYTTGLYIGKRNLKNHKSCAKRSK